MLPRAQPFFPILAVSFSFLFLAPWQHCKAGSSSRITNVSWNLLPETQISSESCLVWFPCWLEKGFYYFFNWKRCINTLKSRGASLRKGRNLIFFFLLRGQEKKGRTIPSFKGIQQLEIFKWAEGGVEKSHERSVFFSGIHQRRWCEGTLGHLSALELLGYRSDTTQSDF